MHYLYDVISVTVVDGDTVQAAIDLGFDLTYHADVRIIGVDTPEKRIVAQRAAAAKSSAFVAKWFEENKGKVVLRSSRWDKYGGRVLGDFSVYGGPAVTLSALLIERGYGKAYSGGKKLPWSEEELSLIESLP